VASIASATTDGSVVAAVTGKKIRVHGYVLSCAGTATTLTFNTKPGGAGSAISHTHNLPVNANVPVPLCGDQAGALGWFETNAGEGLTATTGTGSTCGVLVVYSEV
jgi:hypothetical protein